MPQRKFCPHCKYPMLSLMRYDGTSSRHAPRTLGRFSDGEMWWSALQMPFMWLLPTENFIERNWIMRRRRKRAARIKTRVLPIDPEAQICPHCLHIEWSFVRL